MKAKAVFTPILLVPLFFAVAGCSTQSAMSRIESNRTEYDSWPIEVRQAILDGRVEQGMTQRQVEVAKGEPSEVYNRGGDEIWVYREGGGGGGIPGLSGTNIGLGTSIGGIGVSGRPNIGGQSSGSYSAEGEVVFRNGEVVSSSLP